MLARERRREDDGVACKKGQHKCGAAPDGARRGGRACYIDARIAVVAKVQIGKQIDAEKADGLLRWLDDAFDVDHRREADAIAPQRLQLKQHVLVEPAAVADDLVVRASGNCVD